MELVPDKASLKKVSAFALFQVKVTSQVNCIEDIDKSSGSIKLSTCASYLAAVSANLILTAAAVAWVLLASSYEGIDKIDHVAYALIMFSGFMLFIYLDAVQKFHRFHRYFERCFNGRGQTVFSASLIVVGFVDYLLIEIYYRVLSDSENTALLIALYVLFYASLVLMFFTFMAYWEVFAFYCAEYSYVHGFLYLSLLGGIVLFFARLVHPPKEGDWHHPHGSNVILDGILNVISLFFIFLVVLAGIGIALFSEFGQNADKMGTPLAFFLLGALSMVVMLTPLAPGNVVDVCGGFVIVQILMQQEGLSFWNSWLIATIAVVHIHFVGACSQWYIGKLPCVQAWGNATLPVAMLAASDAVLKEANCFRVGLIGYVFMDTANGLNQGRINMEFWTQLLSEWACIPNAIPLVSLGAAVAVSGDESLKWVKLALPVLILLATCWQMLGTSFGANAMGSCTDGKKYWTSREKWIVTQTLTRAGYTPTKAGWGNDVYQLAKITTMPKHSCTNINEKCLYEKISKVHSAYLKERNDLKTENARLERYEAYNTEISIIREEHIRGLSGLLRYALNEEWLRFRMPIPRHPGWFDREGHLMYKKIIVCMLMFCFWTSIYGIYNQVYMRDAVSLGLKVLDRIKIYAWVAFVVFIILEILYFHTQIFAGILTAGSTVMWLCQGCKTDPSLETRFDTPLWNQDVAEENVKMVIYDEEERIPAGDPVTMIDTA